ncbi:IucA/IucC family protein [Staphylococcus felis]|uniref:IucA/IucC family protein n=1 Tax=Staphylococcus felis TaxID=46127 RepID=UPI003F42A91E
MSVNHQKKAEQNIQYRVLLACVKESLFPDDTRTTIQNGSIKIQRHQHCIHVEYETRSAFYQFELNGPITYTCGRHSQAITSLDELMDVLKMHFDIHFHERLMDELHSSCLGLTLSYEQYAQRQTAIQHSLKFSRMPNTLNFLSWLLHMNDDEHFSGLGYTEGMVWEGHPSHPLTKTKLPLTKDEMKRYAPEFMKIIPLRVVLVHQSFLNETSMNEESDFVLDRIIPELKTQLHHFMASFDYPLEVYKVMFVHPWQYENVIVKQFEDEIEKHLVIPTPHTVESKATLSFRTMALVHKPYHIKLPVNIQATSAVRTVSTVTTVDGPKLSHQLQDMLEIYPSLKVAAEPYGAYVDVEKDLARQFAMIVRYAPSHQIEEDIQIVTAALTQYNPVDHQVTVDSLIEHIYGEVNSSTIQTFIRHYAERLITPLIGYIQTYGIALEAHQQNTILQLDKDTHEFSFIVRDLGGARIDIDTLSQTVPNIEVTNQSLVADCIEDVIAKFQHAVIQNQLGTLIHHFHHKYDVSEEALYQIVKETTERAIRNHLRHADTLREVLFGHRITVKALLNMRMQQKVKKYVQIQLDNPLKGEV